MLLVHTEPHTCTHKAHLYCVCFVANVVKVFHYSYMLYSTVIIYYRGEETIPLTDCLQVTFSRSCRHHLFLLYSREVVILDVEINQAVGVITLERNASPLLYLMPCIQRDVIYCLHENGCVSVRIQQALQFPNGIPTSTLDSQVSCTIKISIVM